MTEEKTEKRSKVPVDPSQRRLIRRFDQLEEWIRSTVAEIEAPHEYHHERTHELSDLESDCQEKLDSIRNLLVKV